MCELCVLNVVSSRKTQASTIPGVAGVYQLSASPKSKLSFLANITTVFKPAASFDHANIYHVSNRLVTTSVYVDCCVNNDNFDFANACSDFDFANACSDFDFANDLCLRLVTTSVYVDCCVLTKERD